MSGLAAAAVPETPFPETSVPEAAPAAAPVAAPTPKAGNGRHVGLLAGVIGTAVLFLCVFGVMIFGFAVADFTPAVTKSTSTQTTFVPETTTKPLPAVPFSWGEKKKKKKKNEWANLLVTAPEDYIKLDESEYEGLSVTDASKTQNVVFGMFSPESSVSGVGSKAVFILQLVRFADYVKPASEQQQISGILQENIKQYGGEIEFSVVTLGGEGYTCGKYSYEKDGVRSCVSEYVRLIDHDLISIEIIGDSFEDNDAFLSCIDACPDAAEEDATVEEKSEADAQ